VKETKNRTHVSILCVLSLFPLLILTPTVLSTTIADTTFPAEVGKRYVWDFTDPPENKGMKCGFTVDSITQGIDGIHESLIVYGTISTYAPSTGWGNIVTNMFYLAANETQNYLHFNLNWLNAIYGTPFVIPTPINITLVAEALHAAGGYSTYDYSIDGNTITFNTTHYTAKYTFNSGGFLTVCSAYSFGELSMKAVLESSANVGGIPFGIYFLIPTVSSIAAIVIFVKKRQLRTE
jgi:hypothetical protein